MGRGKKNNEKVWHIVQCPLKSISTPISCTGGGKGGSRLSVIIPHTPFSFECLALETKNTIDKDEFVSYSTFHHVRCSPLVASNIAAPYLGEEGFLVLADAQLLQPLHLSEVDHLAHEGLSSDLTTDSEGADMASRNT